MGRKRLFYCCVNRLSIKTGWKGRRYPYFTSIRTLTYLFVPIFVSYGVKSRNEGVRWWPPSLLSILITIRQFSAVIFSHTPWIGKVLSVFHQNTIVDKTKWIQASFSPSPRVNVGSWKVLHQNQHWRTGKLGSRKGGWPTILTTIVFQWKNENTGWN